MSVDGELNLPLLDDGKGAKSNGFVDEGWKEELPLEGSVLDFRSAISKQSNHQKSIPTSD